MKLPEITGKEFSIKVGDSELVLNEPTYAEVLELEKSRNTKSEEEMLEDIFAMLIKGMSKYEGTDKQKRKYLESLGVNTLNTLIEEYGEHLRGKKK